jgi:hypothetical protein
LFIIIIIITTTIIIIVNIAGLGLLRAVCPMSVIRLQMILFSPSSWATSIPFYGADTVVLVLISLFLFLLRIAANLVVIF